MNHEDRENLYVKMMTTYQDSLDDSFFGLSPEAKSCITQDIAEGNITLAANAMAPFPRCIPFIIRAEHQIMMIQRQRNELLHG
jgi:hypothetical protein